MLCDCFTEVMAPVDVLEVIATGMSMKLRGWFVLLVRMCSVSIVDKS